jgi:hypothetical protein
MKQGYSLIGGDYMAMKIGDEICFGHQADLKKCDNSVTAFKRQKTDKM